MGLIGDILDPIVGADPPKATESEKQLQQIATAGFLSPQIQGFLPPSLRFGGADTSPAATGSAGVTNAEIDAAVAELKKKFGGIIPKSMLDRMVSDLRTKLEAQGKIASDFGGLSGKGTGGILEAGIQGIGDLIRRPGGLSPNVADAIRQRLAVESEGIAQNFRGIRANQAGALARGNVPVSIRGALGSALDVAQARAQRGARRGALAESEGLRRADLGQTFNILDAILQFTSSGRGQAIQGLGAAGGLAAGRESVAQQEKAANQAFVGSLIPGIGGLF